MAALCPGASGGTLGRDGPLVFNAATLTGGWFSGSVATVSSLSTLTIGSYIGGAIEPNMVLSGAGISGSPKVLYCVACPGQSVAKAPASNNPQGSTWVLDTNLGTIGSESMRVDPTSAMIPYGLTTAPMPNYNYQSQTTGAGICCSMGGGFGAYLVKAGTFQVLDNGTVACQDSNTLAYNQSGGIARAPGLRRAS